MKDSTAMAALRGIDTKLRTRTATGVHSRCPLPSARMAASANSNRPRRFARRHTIAAGERVVPKQSAGLLVYRQRDSLEVFLVHPGGPFWAKKDLGAWSIPKGEYLDGEEPLKAAQREFQEETGFQVEGEFLALGAITQSSGKIVSAWACAGDFDPSRLTSNSCELEWPPRSGRLITIPEVDRGAWFSIAEAGKRIVQRQRPILQSLVKILGGRNDSLMTKPKGL
jgi:predicted NUDIX family NTP pyrophosphohydrolase